MLHEGKEFSWSRSDRLFSFDGGDRACSGNAIKRKQPQAPPGPQLNSISLVPDPAGGAGDAAEGGIPISECNLISAHTLVPALALCSNLFVYG